jgi:hypothetical protein
MFAAVECIPRWSGRAGMVCVITTAKQPSPLAQCPQCDQSPVYIHATGLFIKLSSILHAQF